MKTVYNFPAGKLIRKTATVNGNVNTEIECPTGKRWLLLSYFHTLVCDGTAANRTIQTLIETTADLVCQGLGESQVLTASETNWIQGFFNSPEHGSGARLYDSISFGYPVFICDGEQLQVSVENGVAGDQLTYHFRLLEIDIE